MLKIVGLYPYKSMTNRTFQLNERQLDLELWQKLYYKHQQEYLRKRLLAIKYLYEGSRTEVSALVNCTYKTLSTWIDKFLEGGLNECNRPRGDRGLKHNAFQQLKEL